MYLALNNLQRLICYKTQPTNQPTNQPTKFPKVAFVRHMTLLREIKKRCLCCTMFFCVDSQIYGAVVEYTECISAEEYDPPPTHECSNMTLNNLMVMVFFFFCLMAYQLFLGYLMPKSFS